jgi:hypothetical protein
MPYLRVLVTVLALSSLGACSSEIGDPCSVNIDCSPNGDRICDTAQREGYCTVQGCGPVSCPQKSICVSFYPANLLSTACNPLTEDAVGIDQPSNDCRVDEVCLESGFCAQSAAENRFCMKTCESDDDCRDGYECRRTGTGGAEPVINPDEPNRREFRFCAQRR